MSRPRITRARVVAEGQAASEQAVKPCKRGHQTRRNASGHCADCENERVKAFYALQKTHINARRRAAYAAAKVPR
jgi:hypothetical protein